MGQPTGRPRVKPSVTDPEGVRKLCEYLATGMSLRASCQMPDAPGEKEVYIRLASGDEVFGGAIARARELGQERLVDEMQDIADAATPETWQVARLQIWQRQWTAAKRASKKYGDKLQHANAAGDGDVTVQVVRFSKDEKSET